jgi:NAD+ kinase
MSLKSPNSTSYERIAFVASPVAEATAACESLSERYGNAAPATADVIVALGGDGFMLQTLHRFMSAGKPIYGMHRGTIGFLMNEYGPEHLHRRLAAARKTVVHPLLMRARDNEGRLHESHAFNE